ncbi:MAG: hypothetical protein ACE14V_03350 [bacterium]
MQIEEKVMQGFNLKVISMNQFRIGIAVDIGPRILYLAHHTKPALNVFNIMPEAGSQTADGFWHIYGGHRLWSSPEATPRSYSLDNQSVKLEFSKDKITIIGNPEPSNAIQKKIYIQPAKGKLGIEVVHTITNIGRWPVQLACWALSVMRQNGTAIIPIIPHRVDEAGLLPDRHLSLWPYTSLADKRLTFLDKYILVQQNPKITNPIKLSTKSHPDWVAYWVQGLLFVKRFKPEPGAYPDFGSNVEVYTNDAMLEVETLGPLKTIRPGESIQHIEWWNIIPFGNTKLDINKIGKVMK